MIELGMMMATLNEIRSTMAYGKGRCHGDKEGDELGCYMRHVEREEGVDVAMVDQDLTHRGRK